MNLSDIYVPKDCVCADDCLVVVFKGKANVVGRWNNRSTPDDEVHHSLSYFEYAYRPATVKDWANIRHHIT